MNALNSNIDDNSGNLQKLLIRTIITQELHAIISSRDYKSRYASLSRVDKKKVRENQERIADIATDYFINNNGHNMTDDNKVAILYSESIEEAMKQF